MASFFPWQLTASTIRAWKECSQWYVCDSFWYMVGQWWGNSFVPLILCLYGSILFLRSASFVLSVEKAMEKLAVVLDGYNSVEVVPSLFILMGNFCSRPCNLAFNSFSSLRSGLFMNPIWLFYFPEEKSIVYWENSCRSQFGKLGEMISARSRLKEQSRFLLIPGPDDAGYTL